MDNHPFEDTQGIGRQNIHFPSRLHDGIEFSYLPPHVAMKRRRRTPIFLENGVKKKDKQEDVQTFPRNI